MTLVLRARDVPNLVGARRRVAAAAPPDATLALSQHALTTILERELDGPHNSSGSGSWGPFEAGYDVKLNIAGGEVSIVSLGGIDPQVQLSGLTISGTVRVTVGLGLGSVLPHICIPPVQVCTPSVFGLGQICSPQVCISWPSISTTVPLSIPPVNLSVNFQPALQQKGTDWELMLKVFPFSVGIDLTPSVNTLISAVEADVRNAIGGIPLIGDLIDNLVDMVLSVLNGVIDDILRAISDLAEEVILVIDLFSPTIPFSMASIPGTITLMPAGTGGDRAVQLSISPKVPPSLTVDASQPYPEIVIGVNFA